MMVHTRNFGRFKRLAPLAAILVALNVGCGAPEEEAAEDSAGAMAVGDALIAKFKTGSYSEYLDGEGRPSGVRAYIREDFGMTLHAQINWPPLDIDAAQIDVSTTDRSVAVSKDLEEPPYGGKACAFTIRALDKETIRVKSECGKGDVTLHWYELPKCDVNEAGDFYCEGRLE